MRFYLDEDQSDKVAALARRYGVDVTCSHEAALDHLPDDAQLAHAAGEGRAMVTRNYSDFQRFTAEFERHGLPHAGVLFLPPSLPNDDFSGIARAIVAYDRDHPDGMLPYAVDWLRRAGSGA